MTINKNDVKKAAMNLHACKPTCVQHDGNQDFIDSMNDHEVIELWFSPDMCGKVDGCDNATMTEIMKQAQRLAKTIVDKLPNNRVEKTNALFKLEEATMWACACVRRAKAVANVLQKKRGFRELAAAERAKFQGETAKPRQRSLFKDKGGDTKR